MPKIQINYNGNALVKGIKMGKSFHDLSERTVCEYAAFIIFIAWNSMFSNDRK